MLKVRALLLSLVLLVLDPLAVLAEDAKPLTFKQKHPILYWSVAGPTYPVRHPKKTLNGVCYPIAHPGEFGKKYEQSGVSGTINFLLQLGTAAGVYTTRRVKQ